MKDDGGPAFPQFMGMATNPEGMSLRDYFAGQALAGLLAGEDEASHFEGFGDRTAEELIAEESYKLADAMLAARERK